MRRIQPGLLGLLLALHAFGAGAAGLEPVAQDRSARAWLSGFVDCVPVDHPMCQAVAGPFSEESEQVAAGFEDFVASVSTQASSAGQDSSIRTYSIRANGSFSASYLDHIDSLGGLTSYTTAWTNAHSRFSTSFDLHRPSSYVLTGTLEGFETWTTATLRVDLLGPGGPVAEIRCTWDRLEATAWCYETTEQVSGVLPAGRYTLEAEVQGSGSPPELGGPPLSMSDGRYVVEFTLPGSAPALTPAGVAVWASLTALLGVRLLRARGFGATGSSQGQRSRR